MKFFAIVAFGLLLASQVVSQTSVDRKSVDDWSNLFPEIPGCERVVQPIRRQGKLIEQTAEYELGNYKKLKNNPDYPNYFGCGSITLRLEPSARQNASKRDPTDMMPPQPANVRGFFALRDSPQCGNDPWVGSTSVYFDNDKVLIVSVYFGADKISEFAETADYRTMSKVMGKPVR